MSRFRFRVHGVRDGVESVFLIGRGVVVEGRDGDDWDRLLPVLFLSLGSLVEVEGNSIIVGSRAVDLGEVDVIPAWNYLTPSFHVVDVFVRSGEDPLPVLPYFDVVYGKPAVAVPEWFRRAFEERCRLCRSVR